jgi:hypothetical protein
MLRVSICLRQSGQYYKRWQPKPTKRRGISQKQTDNTPFFDRGPVEWLPRPVRLDYDTLDEARDWMMRQTLDGQVEEFNTMRSLMKEWSQQSKRPILGEVEPRFPVGVVKRSHSAPRRFELRWAKANSPNNWLWMPREPSPLHWPTTSEYPENWKAMREAHRTARVTGPSATPASIPAPGAATSTTAGAATKDA